jgi:hypothetical protein
MEARVVDPEAAAFRYFALFQENNTAYEDAWIEFSFYGIAEGNHLRSGGYSIVGDFYPLNASVTTSVVGYSTRYENRTEGNPPVVRRLLVQEFRLSNNATVLISNSFFSDRTNLTFYTTRGNISVGTNPRLSKFNVAVYDWPWIDQAEHNVLLYMTMDFHIPIRVDGSGETTFPVITVDGLDEFTGLDTDRYTVSGSMQLGSHDLQFGMEILKFAVDVTSEYIGMSVDGRDFARALADLSYPPYFFILNTSLIADSFTQSFEYDPSFQMLLVPPTPEPGAPPQSLDQQGYVTGVAIGATLAGIALIAGIGIIARMQYVKFNARVKIPTEQQLAQRGLVQPSTPSSPASSTPASPSSSPSWTSVTSNDVRRNTLSNVAH